MVFDIYTLVEAIWIILPAFAANGLVPLFKGRRPMDGGRKFYGRPLLGKGKTWEGLFWGIVIAMFISFIMLQAHPYLPWGISPVPLTIVPMSLQLGFLLGLGTMLGDAGGSFIKRRYGIESGRPAPLLDQVDFLIGSLFFAALLVPVKPSWAVLLLVLTPLCHWAANLIAYKLKVKSNPW